MNATFIINGISIRVLGSNGLLGSCIEQAIEEKGGYIISSDNHRFSSQDDVKLLISPDHKIILNCIGLVDIEENVKRPLVSKSLNSTLPTLLASKAHIYGSRLLHISTPSVASEEPTFVSNDDSRLERSSNHYGYYKYRGEKGVLHSN